MGGNLMTSHLQNNHRLHLPSTKYVLLPVVVIEHDSSHNNTASEGRVQWKNTAWMFVSCFDEIWLYSPLVELFKD